MSIFKELKSNLKELDQKAIYIFIAGAVSSMILYLTGIILFSLGMKYNNDTLRMFADAAGVNANRGFIIGTIMCFISDLVFKSSKKS